MKKSYLTELGDAGIGRGMNRSPQSAVLYTHDIFMRAAEEGLDVYMLCGSLCEDLRDKLYKSHTKENFADSIRKVLEVGCDVSIFIWDNVVPQSPACVSLIPEAESKDDWGTFELRISGTRKHEEEINHFIIAKSRDDKRWIARIERPHRRHTVAELNDESFEVPAAIFFDSNEARKNAEGLLEGFKKLCASVDAGATVAEQM